MKRAIITVGMQFGDEAKGATVDALCSKFPVDLVVRYSGGCQASHRVVCSDGREHKFAQWGSGTLRGVPTYLGPNVIVNPLNMVREAEHLKEIGVSDPWSMLRVHPDCLIATPYHEWANQIDELSRGDNRHGSCGQGIGRTRSYWLEHGLDAPTVKDLRYVPDLEAKLRLVQQRLSSKVERWRDNVQIQNIADKFMNTGPHEISVDLRMSAAYLQDEWWSYVPWNLAVFEGAQGVLLDQCHGFSPHNTWSVATTQHAKEMCVTVDCINIKTIGCIKAFTTRHGEGPLPSFSKELTEQLNDSGNPENEWQGNLRIGCFDFGLFQYAVDVQPVDVLAVSWLDRFNSGHNWIAIVNGDDLLAMRTTFFTFTQDQFLEHLGVPVAIKGFGPTAEDRILNEELFDEFQLR